MAGYLAVYSQFVALLRRLFVYVLLAALVLHDVRQLCALRIGSKPGRPSGYIGLGSIWAG